MLTTFTLLAATGFSFRLALAWGLRRRYDLRLTIPEALAAIVLVLAGFARMAEPNPVPLALQFHAGGCSA